MMRNHGITPKPSRSRADYYRTHRQPESNTYLVAAFICAVLVVGAIIGGLLGGLI